ncbi:ABC transporter transmembrane domain-containing protein [Microlunatus soli]|uniref:ABC transporter transmembrane domain-containing protein n=1 Tax=Microlunatus soli TaxID=630515 RepID=UPI001E359414|nr:ABC transporter ATP-binding protein [Microlunatus soli]
MSDRAEQRWSPPSPRDLAGPFRFLFWLTRSQLRRVAVGAGLGIGWAVGLAVPPWALAHAIDDGFVAGDHRALVGWSVVLLITGILIAALSIARHRTMTKIRMDASFRAARTTVWHTSRLGASLRSRVNAGEVVTVGIADVQTVAMALTVTGPGVGAVVGYLVVAVLLVAISPVLAVVILLGVPLLAVAVGPLLHRIERTGGEYRVQQGRLTTRLVDALAGLGVLNGLGGKAWVADRYAQQSRRVVAAGYRVAKPASWVGALATGLPSLFLAAVVWLSARLAASGAITIGDLVAVYGYVAVLVVPVAQFIEGAGDIARARVAAHRIIDLLNLPAGQDTDPVPVRAGCGPLVDPESGVVVRPGLLTALVATHPVDARTVIERLGRLPHPATITEAATWNGVPITDLDRNEFRTRLLVADNDAEVFAGTVREIVAGRLEPDDVRIRAALRIAAADDVVQALPGGLDAAVAAGGRDLSGGQRQRIRLARAVYAAPDVLIAVDPTSAVDANTEAVMINRLGDSRREVSTMISTSSPLVLDRADEVIFLADGRVSAIGTHAELTRTVPGYRDLVSRAQNDIEGEDR